MRGRTEHLQVAYVDGEMSDIPVTTRNRIEAQGFLGFDDRMLAQINYWLRLSPAICMVWTAIGTALSSALILWALAPFALLGGPCTTYRNP